MSKLEAVTDIIIINMLRSQNYIDGNFNNINKNVLVWARKAENSIINDILSNASKKQTGNQGYPEFIIYDQESNLVIVIENKSDIKYHIYEKDIVQCVADYAVNGALWYASFLKNQFDTIAIGVSGSTIETLKIDTYGWKKSAETFTNFNIKQIKKIEDYRNLIHQQQRIINNSEQLKLLSEKSKLINEFLRSYLGVLEHKRLYALGSILFALEDPAFKMCYSSFNNNKELAQFLYQTLDRKIKNAGLRKKEIIKSELQPVLENLGINDKEAARQKFPNGTLLELVRNVDNILFEYYKKSELDLIALFFNVFLSYSTSGGSDLGIVLTPSHITKLFCELADININSKILDPCVGTGGFLTAAWKKISLNDKYSFSEKEKFRKENIIGVEKETSIYTIVALNMFINKDGRSNLYCDDCFAIKDTLLEKECNVGFINPPYSDEIYSEISFVELMLDVLLPNSIGVAIIPVNAVSSRTKKHSGLISIKERILTKHKLLASIKMPCQLFYPKGTETIILVFETHSQHIGETWFAEFNDGYELIKNQKMRTPKYIAEQNYQNFLDAYKQKSETKFSFKKIITAKDQWVYTLHKEFNYLIKINDIQNTVNNYFAYLVQNRYFKFLPRDYYNTQNKYGDSIDIINHLSKELLITYFDILPTKQIDKINIELSNLFNPKAIPFIGRKGVNNGVSDYVIPANGLINNGNTITIALDGSTGSTFYQHHDFCSGQNIWILKIKEEKLPNKILDPDVALFLTTSIRLAVQEYSYNLGLTKGRLQNISFLLPLNKNKTINVEFIKSLMAGIDNSVFLKHILGSRY
ncbi:N-6 DNA methylase [Candidatus Tisiphia endosymbiont of Mystacides longicornis]|uniref:N-6 DNA methylase n=1 Tax=Candidatus Tisiphia endosymbiont of Mystacides longicornis TaxID=3139330 RepID=UPI003CCAF75B